MPNDFAASSACRREEDMRAGPRYLSLEPPPPGCDPGEADGAVLVALLVLQQPLHQGGLVMSPEPPPPGCGPGEAD